ncbi:MAG: hypothetical protein A2161_20130 [Candidatus Schekmanbacteria bacterium RBG_13_48_7]|uniref:Uncharacterized protein n=1 Tax=Candidatus Schekmanbacteria bacterium RBG_13_48_7 TaxID=1817878 RepID=A0A1F7S189_9BACT|nr:MAG: hypothetical protein A2161_20130 [Candidatus Schekmanbacteria bacterium RBG_13_48_7]
MWVTIGSYIYLVLLFWVGVVIGFLVWKPFSQKKWEEKLLAMKQDMISGSPIIREFENKIVESRKLIEARSSDLEGLMNDWFGKMDTVVDLEKRLTHAETSTKAKANEIESLKISLRERDTELQELEQRLAVAQKGLDTNRTRHESFKAKLTDWDFKLIELERKIANTDKSAHLRDEETKRRTKEFQDVDKQILSLNQKIAKNQSLINECKLELDPLKNDVNEHAEKSTVIVNKLAASIQSYEREQQDAIELKKLLLNQDEDIENLKKRMAITKNELDKNNSRTGTLNKQVADYQAAIKDLSKKIVETEKGTEIAAKEVKSKSDASVKAESRAFELRQQVAIFEQNVAFDKEKLADQQKDVKSLENDITHLQREVFSYTKLFESQTAEHHGLIEKLTAVTDKMVNLEREVNDAQISLDNDREKYKQKTHEVLEKGSLISDLGRTLQSLKDRLITLDSGLKNTETTVSERKKDLEKLKQEKPRLSNAISGKNAEIKQLEKSLAQNVIKVSGLQDKLSQTQDDLSAKNIEIPKLEERLAELTARVSSLRDYIDQLKGRLKGLTTKGVPNIEELKSILKDKRDNFNKLKDKKNKYDSDFDLIREKVTTIKIKNTDLDKEIEDLRKRVAKLERVVTDIDHQREMVIADKDRIDTRLKDIMNKLNIVRGTVDEKSIQETSSTVTRGADSGTVRTVTTTSRKGRSSRH